MSYKTDFIEFMVRSEVLRFGDFTTKSGRQTPYFINSGNYDTGERVAKLGEFYARAIHDTVGLDFDNLYGPAYKGIPLAVTTAAALWRLYQMNVSYTFDRKEVKDHGEGGQLVGHKYSDGERVLIIEDVMTAGTSIYESVPKLRAAANVEIVGVMISVDRREKGRGDRSARAEIKETFGFDTRAIVSIDEIVDYLSTTAVDEELLIDDAALERIQAYRAQYGG
jgi:orotate phosphoribosyltransferase